MAELEARKRARELDERAKNLDLEAARKIDAERQKIQEEASKRADEQYQLKLAEKEKQIQDAKKANDELKRKLEQGSQQTQGEVLELQLEELLRTSFPMDQIEPVPKGVSGADVIQKVLTRSGSVCGTIVWESKHTKAWSDGWVQKLKDDQRRHTAEMAVLVSETLPKGCNTFVNMQGIWITGSPCAMSLAMVLRMQLLQIASARAAADGAKQKSEILYEYVVESTEFRHRVRGNRRSIHWNANGTPGRKASSAAPVGQAREANRASHCEYGRDVRRTASACGVTRHSSAYYRHSGGGSFRGNWLGGCSATVAGEKRWKTG